MVASARIAPIHRRTRRHDCRACRVRPAVSDVQGRHFAFRRDHPLCSRCWRSLCDAVLSGARWIRR
jgi:hypothetical protein